MSEGEQQIGRLPASRGREAELPPDGIDLPPNQAKKAEPEHAEDGIVERFMALFASGGMQPQDQLLNKLNTQQINKILDQTAEDAKRAHELRKSGMNLFLILALAVLVSILLTLFLFLHYGKGELLREILFLLVGLGGGGIGGFSVGRYTAKPTESSD